MGRLRLFEDCIRDLRRANLIGVQLLNGKNAPEYILLWRTRLRREEGEIATLHFVPLAMTTDGRRRHCEERRRQAKEKSKQKKVMRFTCLTLADKTSNSPPIKKSGRKVRRGEFSYQNLNPPAFT